MVGEKRPPGLRWRRSTADEVLGDGGLGDLKAELPELAVNPRRTPQGVGARHRTDEGADVRGDGRAAGLGPAALPGPEEPEPGPLPPDDGLGLDDGDDLRPAVPQTGEQDPKQAVGGAQAWARRGPVENGQLMPQREVLEHQGALGPKSEEEAREDQGSMPAIIDRAGRNFNVDEADGASGRDTQVDLLGFARSHRGVGQRTETHAPAGDVNVAGTARRQELTPLADRSDDGDRRPSASRRCGLRPVAPPVLAPGRPSPGRGGCGPRGSR